MRSRPKKSHFLGLIEQEANVFFVLYKVKDIYIFGPSGFMTVEAAGWIIPCQL